jgi:hypothetical protein
MLKQLGREAEARDVVQFFAERPERTSHVISGKLSSVARKEDSTSGRGYFRSNAERSLLRCLPYHHCTIARLRAISAVSVRGATEACPQSKKFARRMRSEPIVHRLRQHPIADRNQWWKQLQLALQALPLR